ncbi:MAG: type II toxin-antitoxin system RelE/ParE family toxin [Nanoarchaeota archaeon]|nr:type II toxin-antitoxin system RelE/ParE family toxin [Nanoarchaeota archaeon]
MHELTFDVKTIKQLSKLPNIVRERIYAKLRASKENPFRYFERLQDRQDYKLRVGNYRVIADIKDNRIYVTIVSHRRNVYE